MSINSVKSDRRMLPRWRKSILASRSTDFINMKQIREVKVRNDFRFNLTENQQTQELNLGIAAEKFSEAILSGKSVEPKYVHYVLSSDSAPNTLLRVATEINNGNVPFSGKLAEDAIDVSQLRKLLRIQPNNPLLWADLARHSASLGHKKKSNKFMKVALQLAPNHRWILRTAARFYVHIDEKLEAHKLLASHQRTKYDPWLIAAELACAQVAGKSPKFWTKANDLLNSNTISPLHASELAVAVAMMELESGNRKKAKKFVKKGLIAPTENALAQVGWAMENKHLNDGFELDNLIRKREDAFEAESQLDKSEGFVLPALESAYQWSNDEPFAARPKFEIAYLASLIDDHDTTIQMANQIQRIDGDISSTLELNRLYALMSSGKLDRDKDYYEIELIRNQLLRIGSEDKKESYHALANLGLWYYRFDNPEVGKELYGEAISFAVKAHQLDSAAMAATIAAREAILANDTDISDALIKAKDLTKRSKNKDSEFYLRKLDDLQSSVEKAEEILNPKSAEKYQNKREKVARYRVEGTGIRRTIWLQE